MMLLLMNTAGAPRGGTRMQSRSLTLNGRLRDITWNGGSVSNGERRDGDASKVTAANP